MLCQNISQQFGNLNLRPFEILVAFNNLFAETLKNDFTLLHPIKKSNSLSLKSSTKLFKEEADNLCIIFKQDF